MRFHNLFFLSDIVERNRPIPVQGIAHEYTVRYIVQWLFFSLSNIFIVFVIIFIVL